MTDPDFDTELAQGLMAPGPERPDLVRAVVAHAAAADRERRALLLGATLAGAGVAVGIAALAGMFDVSLWRHITLPQPGPIAVAIAGLAAALAASGFAALREA